MRVAICGAGIAGPTLAYFLHRSGHTPTVIERAPALRTGGYVVDFWGIGYRVAQQMGLETAIRAVGYPMRTLRVVRSDGSVLADIDVTAFERAQAGRYITVARSDLAAAICASIADDVEMVFDDTIVGLDERPDGITVGFQRNRTRDFDLVVGADGLHSQVRALVFPQAVERYLGAMVAVAVVRGYRPREELTYLMCNLAGGQLGRVSLHDDRTLLLFVARSARPVPEHRDVPAWLREKFADVGGEGPAILASLDDAEDLYFDAVSQIQLDQWARGRVALLGDAAAAVSLLAGEGTGLAMAQAYVLAGELQRADDDHRAAFDAYQRRLQPFLADKQAAARRYVSFFAGRTRAGVALRNLALRAAGVAPVTRYVAAHGFRDDVELPHYPL